MKFMPVLSFPVAKKLGYKTSDFVRSADAQVEVLAWIAEHVPTDAVIGPMDLSIEAEAFGATARYPDEDVPAIVGRLVEDEEGANALAVPAANAGRCGIAPEAIVKLKAKGIQKPVYGGMIGPFSLAGRLMDVTEVMFLMMDEPDTVKTVVGKATEFLIAYGRAIKRAGADGLFMAEPLAGVVSPDGLAEFSAPYVKRIVEALQDEKFPVVYHNCGTNVIRAAEAIFAQGAAGYHFGNAIDLKKMLEKAPEDVWVMGNVDPAGELANGTPGSVRAATLRLMEACCPGNPNFIVSSGCDIPLHAPWANLDAFFAAVKTYRTE